MLDEQGERPYLLATCARPDRETIDFPTAREKVSGDRRVLLLFGTAWGLAPEILNGADGVLQPLRGTGEYNHLSVRSAVSIILDRLAAPGVER
jgi:hypothetical protein